MSLTHTLLVAGSASLVLAAALALTGDADAAPDHRDAAVVEVSDVRRAPPTLDRTLAAPPAAAAAVTDGAPAGAVALLEERPVGRYGPQVPVEGRTATLSGQVRVDELGARATLRFDSGPNAGAELVTGVDGRFEWPELYPGLGVLTVEAGYRCTRQVVLRHRKQDRLALDLGDHGVVHGRLVDEQGQPVADAPLTLDGQPGVSDGDGRFALACQAAGSPELVVRQPGFVAYREVLRPEDGRERPHEIELRRGRSFELQVGAVPGHEDVLVWLRPLGAERMAGAVPRPAFPWEQLNPVRASSQGMLRLDDLPPVKLEVLAVHPLARARATAWPRRESTSPTPLALTFEPTPALTVRVERDGVAVAEATVELRFANPLAASLALRGADAGRRLNAEALALLPVVAQRVRSDREGRCRLGRDPVVKGEAYVTVTAPDGSLQVTRRLERRQAELVIDLGAPEA